MKFTKSQQRAIEFGTGKPPAHCLRWVRQDRSCRTSRGPFAEREGFYHAVIASYTPAHREEAWPMLLVGYGGLLAQRINCGALARMFEHFAAHDCKQGQDLARAVSESDSEAQSLLLAAQAAAADILNPRWNQVIVLADELCLRGRLDADEIKIITTAGPACRR